jgi:hypothetical protein
VKDQPLATIDDLITDIAGIPIEELAKEATADGQHLISVEELRTAGALDVPATWRKSLGGKERRHTLPGFEDDDEPPHVSPKGSSRRAD